ncbi:MAG: GntR family transcriptional regulator [Peptostreptococcaceae bacterium]|nr:GntR family transcriptional regulator [Peptostreptococcaceae bacterium]
MEIIISNSKGVHIYEQIYEQMKDQIISNILKDDYMLPSIRTLAKDLKISVITTKRAYTELENRGYIYTIPGKGSYVAKRDKEVIKEMYLKEIEEHMTKILKLSKSCEISFNELTEMFTVIAREEENECNRD